MTEQKRKVLGINRNTIALNRASNVSSAGRGTVLVITKGSKTPKEQSSKSAELAVGSLTEQERHRRLTALQSAGKSRLEQQTTENERKLIAQNQAAIDAERSEQTSGEGKSMLEGPEGVGNLKEIAGSIESMAKHRSSEEAQLSDNPPSNHDKMELTSMEPITNVEGIINNQTDQKDANQHSHPVTPINDILLQAEKSELISDPSKDVISDKSKNIEKSHSQQGEPKDRVLLRPAPNRFPAPIRPFVRSETKQITLENVKEIMQKGRVRNLDPIHKKVEDIAAENGDITDIKAADQAATTTAEGLQAVRRIATKAKPQTSGGIIKAKPLAEKEDKTTRKAVKPNKSQPQRKLSASQMIQMTASGGDEHNFRGGRKKHRKDLKSQVQAEKIARDVMIPDVISVQELANRMSEKAANVIKALMRLGVMATINQSVDADTAELICGELGHNFKRVTSAEILGNLLVDEQDREEDLQLRNPVVTVMGHVDHGKTSLLDALRLTDVAAGESGGITQHIGAYKVNLEGDKFITFLDTPGHEAFTAMRMRGAKVTDIVVLVVAADDGIKAQTVEAISHAKAANVPIIVAINKIDRPSANIEGVKNSLFQHNLIPDDMGGDTMVIPVSAKAKIGLDKLEEAILLQADLLHLRANSNRPAKGHVIEAHIDKGRGVVATFLVEKGTLKTGDIVVVGNTFGKIRAMIDDKSHYLKEAGPSVPTEIIGLDGCPIAGDEFVVVADEQIAKSVVSHRIQLTNEKKHAITAKKATSIEDLFSRAKSGLKELAVIVKADVQGSAEAIVQSLEKLANPEVATKVLLGSVGGITESDITLAAASKAVVLGFNVRANNAARDLAKNYNIEIQYYSIIYDLIDNVKKMLGGMLDPITKETIVGQVQIRRVFETSKFGKIAGCYVTEGLVKRGGNIRLLRDNIVVHTGKIKSLKRQKDDAREVKEGFECGISLENFDDIRESDMIEVFEISSEKIEF